MICNTCNCKLLLDVNFSNSRYIAKNYICKDCYNKYNRDMYRNRMDKLGKPQKRKGISSVKRLYVYLFYDNITNREILWHQNIDDIGNLQGIGTFEQRLHKQRPIEKRKEYNRNWRPISEARRKGYGFHKISLDCSDCDWHHVTKDFVVKVPHHIHKKSKHKLNDGNMIEGVIG